MFFVCVVLSVIFTAQSFHGSLFLWFILVVSWAARPNNSCSQLRGFRGPRRTMLLWLEISIKFYWSAWTGYENQIAE